MFDIELNRVAIWAVLIGLLLIVMAFSNSRLKRLPLSGAMIYLLVGYGLGSAGLELFDPNPYHNAIVLERVAEIALLVSLFSAGLKLRLPLADQRWRLSLRLAIITMVITIAMIAALGMWLGLSLGASILVGAILAPTDPVLASDVQVKDASDNDKLRFSLTGESGLNDGTAFPFVILGLTLLQPNASIDIWHWLARDVLWSVGAGLLIGACSGALIGRLVLYLRTEQKEAVGLDEFLVLGLIGISYGVALLLHASTFLSVFAAAVAMTHVPALKKATTRLPAYELEKMAELATNPQHAGPLMMRAVLGFNEQLERIAEVAIVILVGALIPFVEIDSYVLIIIPALMLIIRPVAVMLGLAGVNIEHSQRNLISWFGVRGIGSIFYLLYAINHSLPPSLFSPMLSITLAAITTSIVAHGISVTPLMTLYRRGRNSRKKI